MKAFLDRLFGRAAPTSAPAPAVETAGRTLDEQIAEVRAKIQADVAAGFDDEDVILTHIGGYFEDEIDPAIVRRAAPKLLREALAAHARAVATWPAVTDCDRLDAAFAALEADGVIARQNFTCCMNCGSNEIWEEVQGAIDAGLPAHGYVFYHIQDTDSAVEGRGLHLAYGACKDGEAAALAVGRQIVAQLEAQGLAPQWNGSWEQRIALPLDWKRRRGVPGALG